MKRPVVPLVEFAPSAFAASEAADPVLVNGHVYTLDGENKWDEAPAERGDLLLGRAPGRRRPRAVGIGTG